MEDRAVQVVPVETGPSAVWVVVYIQMVRSKSAGARSIVTTPVLQVQVVPVALVEPVVGAAGPNFPRVAMAGIGGAGGDGGDGGNGQAGGGLILGYDQDSYIHTSTISGNWSGDGNNGGSGGSGGTGGNGGEGPIPAAFGIPGVGGDGGDGGNGGNTGDGGGLSVTRTGSMSLRLNHVTLAQNGVSSEVGSGEVGGGGGSRWLIR